MTGVAAGANFFQIWVHDPLYQVEGASGIFTANSSGGTAYYSLVQHISPAFSTWADGTWNLDSVSPGFRGAIMLGFPEPSSFALGCLGCGFLLLHRRAGRTREE